MNEVFEVLSTSILADNLRGQRRDLISHGCGVTEEPDKRIRIVWPKGTTFHSGTSEYTLPDGWTVKVGR